MRNQKFFDKVFWKFDKKFRNRWNVSKNAETMSLCIYLNQTNNRQTDRQALRTLLHRHLVSHDRVLWQRARTSSVSDIVGTLAMQRRVHSTWHQRRRQNYTNHCNNIHSVYHVLNFLLRYDNFYYKVTSSAPHISTALINPCLVVFFQLKFLSRQIEKEGNFIRLLLRH